MNSKFERSANMDIYENLKVLPEDLMFTDLSEENGSLESFKTDLIDSISQQATTLFKEVSCLFETFKDSELPQSFQDISSDPKFSGFTLTSIMYYIKEHWDYDDNER